MTLKTRNLFFKVFLLFSVVSVALSAFLFVLSTARGTILAPPDVRIPSFLNMIPFMPRNMPAVLISLALIILYVPVCLFLILKYFENTQTTEILFFAGFLLGCLCEIFRLFTICFGLWQTFSNMLIFSGNCVLFGRILAPLSFVCAAILSETEQRQDSERNFVIMTTAALVFAVSIPMNTAHISSTGLVTEGFMRLINIIRTTLTILASLSFYIKGTKQGNLKLKKLAGAFLILISGYALLISADNIIFLAMGASSLIFGTYKYLRIIHQMYMWS